MGKSREDSKPGSWLKRSLPCLSNRSLPRLLLWNVKTIPLEIAQEDGVEGFFIKGSNFI